VTRIHAATKTLSDYPNDLLTCWRTEKRTAKSSCTKRRADLFVVESGSATLIVGGNAAKGETVSPHEKRNGSIQGGTAAQALTPATLYGFQRICRISWC
jgi:hypothetical protein